MDTATALMEEGTALYNKGDAEGYCALYASDVVLTTPDGRFEGQAAVLAYVQSLMGPWPGATVTVGRHCEDGGTYFGEFTLRGTNDGPLVLPDGTELPPTHKTVELSGMEISRVQDGRIVQHDMAWDNMSVLGQLGLVPPS
jgi:ketosteroid isomerase-like protein